MMFRQKWNGPTLMLVALAAASLFLNTGELAAADGKYAVVPTRIIYPGDVIDSSLLDEVKVTNPNLAGGYAESIDQVVGFVTKRTLLPGRTIPMSSLREAFAVKRGANLRLTFMIGNMTISAAGSPLQDALIGDVIKVRNLDSGIIVSGTVMADGTVQVMAK
ncbi:flagellar basal body P-ring formation chaperone FlgA [Agrobacterium sp. ES01]|uniref:flagellar basal body P-ring formation chaperone FlgA n=1 Tax=Agrobacterium sp. ES01 TaxID=3420714 RepID=UPI003D0FCF03